ncbi:AAA family ATPase [Limisalsivibrio acetivorans]|uniref:AAA family ATPase n=1 Tax=Limisalsivibrio acetivorans TaxID=1304888 RepID=UPI0003B4B38D|nr:AAA family ATPase [Limisalsivibrio acetivorans]
MRFKSLQLQGFKSFVDKTAVEFPDGITCVVGPNGSGKSNIMDALRWVFGEQSPKELRGNDMEDIIFSGSKKRKTSGFAEVSLTVTDLPESVTSKWGTLSEVTITRKFYRSGEREYRINNRKCRLKDIREIFYDTGIGPRSISIIEQGKVDKIIQSTPEELRVFFEETAGVVRFKERKKEAERRLGQTRDNLGRVNDIISEIRSHMEALSKQVEQVKRFRELAEKKTDLEKKSLYYKYSRLKEESARLLDEINEARLAMSGIISKFESLTKQETEKEKELSKLRGDYREMNDQMLSMGDSIASLSGDIKILENEISTAEKTRERLHHEIEDMERKLREFTERRVSTLEEKEKAEGEKRELGEKIDELQEQIEEYSRMREDLNEEISEVDSDYLRLTQELTSLSNKVFEKETTANRLEADKKRFTLEKDELENETENAVKHAEELEEKYSGLSTDLDAVSTMTEDVRDELHEARDAESEAREKLESARREAGSLSDRRDMLTSQISSAAVGDSGEYLKNIESTLLIDRMGENAPAHLADILVYSDRDKGRAVATIKEMEGSLRFTFESEAESLIEELLSRPRIDDNIEKIGSLYRKIGSDDRSFVIMGLRNKLAETEERLKNAEGTLQSAEAEYDDASMNAEELTGKLEELEERKSALELDVRTTKHQLEEARAVKEKLSRRGEVIEKEMELALKELEKIEEELASIKLDREEKAAEQREKEDEKSALEDRLGDITALYEDARDDMGSLKIEERGIAEKLNASGRELHYIDREISETTRHLADAKNRLSKLLTVDIVNFKDRLESKKDEYAALMKKQNEIRSKALNADKEVAEVEKELSALRIEIERVQAEVEKEKSATSETEMKRERISSDMDNIAENYLERFETDITEEELDIEGFQPNKAKSELDNIAGQIEGLGPLNMAAEQEYDEVCTRNEFLSDQRKDLEDAISSIHELIGEIDDSTVMLFKDTFEGVKENFKKVFGILFGEGRAELRLSDPDDLLNSGIEIFVQPPGKNLQNMNLLSGGEKAMSACTLLFALFLYRPTPFCFLDEIDAPLDEANIDKFLKIVRTLSADTQFVIITHSQKTMGAADSLYGVTMHEPGVSRMLSVSLSDLKL